MIQKPTVYCSYITYSMSPILQKELVFEDQGWPVKKKSKKIQLVCSDRAQLGLLPSEMGL